uniref:Mucin-19-like n=1 Tax=Petromyzon marinus TaxID=7757 RepID=A0AAJ7XB52_PETMA|nr:mucin-19-like [Petromyzon marinus]
MATLWTHIRAWNRRRASPGWQQPHLALLCVSHCLLLLLLLLLLLGTPSSPSSTAAAATAAPATAVKVVAGKMFTLRNCPGGESGAPASPSPTCRADGHCGPTSLPNWLLCDPSTSGLRGVPVDSDRGSHAVASCCPGTFSLHVLADWESPRAWLFQDPSSRPPKNAAGTSGVEMERCVSGSAAATFASLVLEGRAESLSAERRLQLISVLARYLRLDPYAVTLAPLGTPSQLARLNRSVVAASGASGPQDDAGRTMSRKAMVPAGGGGGGFGGPEDGAGASGLVRLRLRDASERETSGPERLAVGGAGHRGRDCDPRGREPLGPEGGLMEVSWPVACGPFELAAELAQVLSHSVASGRMSGVTGHAVVGWRVLAESRGGSAESADTKIGTATLRKRMLGATATPVLMPATTRLIPAFEAAADDAEGVAAVAACCGFGVAAAAAAAATELSPSPVHLTVPPSGERTDSDASTQAPFWSTWTSPHAAEGAARPDGGGVAPMGLCSSTVPVFGDRASPVPLAPPAGPIAGAPAYPCTLTAGHPTGGGRSSGTAPPPSRRGSPSLGMTIARASQPRSGRVTPSYAPLELPSTRPDATASQDLQQRQSEPVSPSGTGCYEKEGLAGVTPSLSDAVPWLEATVRPSLPSPVIAMTAGPAVSLPVATAAVVSRLSAPLSRLPTAQELTPSGQPVPAAGGGQAGQPSGSSFWQRTPKMSLATMWHELAGRAGSLTQLQPPPSSQINQSCQPQRARHPVSSPAEWSASTKDADVSFALSATQRAGGERSDCSFGDLLYDGSPLEHGTMACTRSLSPPRSGTAMPDDFFSFVYAAEQAGDASSVYAVQHFDDSQHGYRTEKPVHSSPIYGTISPSDSLSAHTMERATDASSLFKTRQRGDQSLLCHAAGPTESPPVYTAERHGDSSSLCTTAQLDDLLSGPSYPHAARQPTLSPSLYEAERLAGAQPSWRTERAGDVIFPREVGGAGSPPAKTFGAPRTTLLAAEAEAVLSRMPAASQQSFSAAPSTADRGSVPGGWGHRTGTSVTVTSTPSPASETAPLGRSMGPIPASSALLWDASLSLASDLLPSFMPPLPADLTYRQPRERFTTAAASSSSTPSTGSDSPAPPATPGGATGRGAGSSPHYPTPAPVLTARQSSTPVADGGVAASIHPSLHSSTSPEFQFSRTAIAIDAAATGAAGTISAMTTGDPVPVASSVVERRSRSSWGAMPPPASLTVAPSPRSALTEGTPALASAATVTTAMLPAPSIPGIFAVMTPDPGNEGSPSAVPHASKTAAAALAGASPNTPPRLLNPIDLVRAQAGRMLSFRVPDDTFFDAEDGDAARLRLSLVPAESHRHHHPHHHPPHQQHHQHHHRPPHHHHHPPPQQQQQPPSWSSPSSSSSSSSSSLSSSSSSSLSSSSWVRFDARARAIVGVPLGGDAARPPQEFVMVARDAGGLETRDAFVIEVLPALRETPSHVFWLTLREPHAAFAANRSLAAALLSKVASFFGDRDARNVALLSLAPAPADAGAPTPGFFWALLPEFWVERLGDTELHGACDTGAAGAGAAGAGGAAGGGRAELAGGEVTRVPLHTSELRCERREPALQLKQSCNVKLAPPFEAMAPCGLQQPFGADAHRSPRIRGWRVARTGDRRLRRTDRVRPAAPRRVVRWDLAINRRVLAPRKAALLPREPRSPPLLRAATNPGFLPPPSPPPPPPRYQLPPAYGRSRATSIFAVLDGGCS